MNKQTESSAARKCMTVFGILLIIFAIISSGVRLGLPFVANYKHAIEARVSDAFRSPVAIGDLSLSWEGYGPVLKAEQVSVFESDERKVTLDALLIDVNLFKSLFRGAPDINELTLVGASLAIEVEQGGGISLHGMESVRTERSKLTGDTPRGRPGVDILAWLLTAGKVGLLDTQITYIDEKAGQRLVMEDLNIRAENVGNMHQLRVDVRLPEKLGGTLEAGIDLIGSKSSIRASDGNLYLKASSVQVKALLELLQLAGMGVTQEPALMALDTAVSLELWGKLEAGKLVSAHGPLGTSAVINTVNGSVVLDSIEAELAYSNLADQTILTASDIVLQGPLDAIEVNTIQAWRTADTESAKGSTDWSAKADGERLDLSSIGTLASAVLGVHSPELASDLQQGRVRGEILDWALVLDTRMGALAVSLDAHLNELSADPVNAIPGFGPISGRIDVIDSVGEVSLSADSMALPWPAMTDETLDLDSLKAVIGLNLSDRQKLRIDADVVAIDDGINLSTRLKTTIEPEQSPHFDVQSRFSATDITAIKPWLPARKLSPELTSWVDSAIQQGTATDGTLLFFGHLSEFPFEEGDGVFRASVDINDGQLAFLPLWPTLNGINGTLELNGLTVTADVGPASLDGFNVAQAAVSIDNLLQPTLRLKTTGDVVLQELIEFGKTGPLKSFLEPPLEDVTGTDRVEMDLDLAVSLYDETAAQRRGADVATAVPLTVDGSIFLSGNTLNIELAEMELSNVRGAIGFDENGVRVNSLKATALDHPVSVSASTVGLLSEAETRVLISGSMKGSDVLAHYGSQLDQFVHGASHWEVELTAPHDADRIAREGVSLHVRSDLVGTEVLLPVPYYKTSGKAQAFELKSAFREGEDIIDWDVWLDGQVHVLARVNGEDLESLLINMDKQPLRASAFDELIPGIRIQGRLERVAVVDWVDSINQLIESFPETEVPELILPMSAAVDIDSFEIGAESMGAARILTNSDETYINAVLSNEFVEGNVRYPREHWTKVIPMLARIDHLDMAVIDALSAEDEADALEPETTPMNPRELPPVNARISSFTFGQLNVRDIVLRAQPDVSGLKITTLGFAYQNMQLVGQGYWHLLDPQGVNPALADQHRTQLNLVLQSDDFGKGLSTVGLDSVISDGEGAVEMQLSWPDAAYLPAIDNLGGKLRLELERGSVIPLEPGAGKVMGLFALQALPRRLNLDFKDISADGLAFTKLSGDADIVDGVVDVSLVQLTGPIGVVDLVGQTNLNTQEFNQRVTILPRVSAALPIIGAISGGASAGVGVLVAAGFLKALGIDFDRLGLRDFSLTGTWDAPEFKSVPTDHSRSR